MCDQTLPFVSGVLQAGFLTFKIGGRVMIGFKLNPPVLIS